MRITRREFLRLATISAAALGLTPSDFLKLGEALASSTSPPVIWLQGAACTGCSIALLNVTNPTIDDVLLNTISLKYQTNLSAAAGELAIGSIIDSTTAADGQFILCIEGGIPTAAGGNYSVIGDRDGANWTILSAVNELGPRAKYVLAVGTCAVYGGVVKPSTYTGIKTVKEILGGKTRNPIINLPTCPAHPESVVGTMITLLTKGLPDLDQDNRPTDYFTTTVHNNCPRRFTHMVSQIGTYGCYRMIGCQGPSTIINCPLIKWNNGVNWCVEADMLCIGCASPTFPRGPFYYSGMYMGSMDGEMGGIGYHIGGNSSTVGHAHAGRSGSMGIGHSLR